MGFNPLTSIPENQPVQRAVATLRPSADLCDGELGWDYFSIARDSGIGCLLRMRAYSPDKLMQTKLPQSRPALTPNLCAKKHSVTVHAAFHSSLRPRDGKEEYAVALGFDIMRNVVIERKQPSGLHLDDLFLSVNLDLTRE